MSAQKVASVQLGLREGFDRGSSWEHAEHEVAAVLVQKGAPCLKCYAVNFSHHTSNTSAGYTAHPSHKGARKYLYSDLGRSC
eukprot:scaffold36204_cov13-Tisochrysis_lutea.AAC.1